MSWVKIEDRFPRHPKIIGLSDRAFRLHITGLCYVAENKTDGFVPLAFAGRPALKVVTELVTSGLWDVATNGWLIHDYLDYNPSASESQQLSQTRSQSGRKGNAARWQDGRKPVAVSVSVSEPVSQDPVGQEPPTAVEKSVDKNPNQPTEDQLYLARSISATFMHKRKLDPPQIVKLNKDYGRVAVTDAMRSMHGPGNHNPNGDSLFAYLRGICITQAAER